LAGFGSARLCETRCKASRHHEAGRLATFRHSYSTLLRANGTDVKVQSELLRHSNIGTTLNLYTQAVSAQKRAAHGQVVGQLLAV
jgi:site-specific recombinase XerD